MHAKINNREFPFKTCNESDLFPVSIAIMLYFLGILQKSSAIPQVGRSPSE